MPFQSSSWSRQSWRIASIQNSAGCPSAPLRAVLNGPVLVPVESSRLDQTSMARALACGSAGHGGRIFSPYGPWTFRCSLRDDSPPVFTGHVVSCAQHDCLAYTTGSSELTANPAHPSRAPTRIRIHPEARSGLLQMAGVDRLHGMWHRGIAEEGRSCIGCNNHCSACHNVRYRRLKYGSRSSSENSRVSTNPTFPRVKPACWTRTCSRPYPGSLTTVDFLHLMRVSPVRGGSLLVK